MKAGLGKPMGPEQSRPKDSEAIGLEEVENEILPAECGWKEKRNKGSSSVTDRKEKKDRQIRSHVHIGAHL